MIFGDRDNDTTRSRGQRDTRLLLAEDDEPLRDLLTSILSLEGHDVTAVASADDIMTELIHDTGAYDVVVTDLRMPGSSALEVVAKLRASGHSVPIIVMTAFPDDAVRLQALSLGTMLIAKPFSLEAMCLAVEWMLDAHSTKKSGDAWVH
jgi:DNA-binding response OmpR family regulator